MDDAPTPGQHGAYAPEFPVIHVRLHDRTDPLETFRAAPHFFGAFNCDHCDLRESVYIRSSAKSQIDRKGKRLNSSPGSTSNAFFCLKTKEHCIESYRHG